MNKLLTTLLMGIVSMTTLASTTTATRPKIVVGIVVDCLRTDYIEHLMSLFGNGGFRRLKQEGVYIKNVDFNIRNLDAVSATAMLYTGNYPCKTGVTGALIYNPETRLFEASLLDAETLGNFTSETYSPRKLRLSTIADEIAIDGGGLGLIYSISANPQQAVIMSAHAGQGAAWINANTGNWATTTYYKEMPQAISQRNYNKSIASRIDTMQWVPSMSLDKYPGLPPQEKYYPFRYTFPKSKRELYNMFINSPLSNEEVTQVAIDYMRSVKLGHRSEAMDMLNIGYTLAPFAYVTDGDNRLELQDAYLRLDAQLNRLFAEIDKTVGLGNALIFLTSTGYYTDATPIDEKYRIPTGEFSVKRAVSLLNSYLVALHGNGNYIKSFADTQFYLDHTTIETKKLDPTQIASEAKLFLCKMSGIDNAHTLTEVLSATNTSLEKLRLAIDAKTSGDIFIEITPGWTLTDDTKYPTIQRTMRCDAMASPMFIMGQSLPNQTISTPVNATTLAPTISQILRIRSPNGAIDVPLTF